MRQCIIWNPHTPHMAMQDVAALKDQVEGMQSGIKALEDAVKGHLASLASSTGGLHECHRGDQDP